MDTRQDHGAGHVSGLSCAKDLWWEAPHYPCALMSHQSLRQPSIPHLFTSTLWTFVRSALPPLRLYPSISSIPLTVVLSSVVMG